jgi:hypothetical protein
MPEPNNPQPIPINAKFEGDFVMQLVVVLDSDTMREFEMRQLEPMMSPFAGRIDTTSDAVLWSFKREEEAAS